MTKTHKKGTQQKQRKRQQRQTIKKRHTKQTGNFLAFAEKITDKRRVADMTKDKFMLNEQEETTQKRKNE